MRKNSKTSSGNKKPKKKNWRRKYGKDPWNDPDVKLELLIAPDLKLKIKRLPPPKLDPHPAFMQGDEDGNP